MERKSRNALMGVFSNLRFGSAAAAGQARLLPIFAPFLVKRATFASGVLLKHIAPRTLITSQPCEFKGIVMNGHSEVAAGRETAPPTTTWAACSMSAVGLNYPSLSLKNSPRPSIADFTLGAGAFHSASLELAQTDSYGSGALQYTAPMAPFFCTPAFLHGPHR